MAYIDVDLLKESVLGWTPPLDNEQLKHMIDTIPTADVVEVKHGEWVVPSGEIKIFEDRYVICSKCNVMLPVVRELDRYWFCPNCGAKMDGGVKSEQE